MWYQRPACLLQSEKKYILMLKVLGRVDKYQISDEILSKGCYVRVQSVCEFLGRLATRDK